MSLDTSGTPNPTGYTRTVSAFFDTHGAAQTASDDLIAAGVAREQITLTAGQGAGEAVSAEPDTGILATLKNLFLPESDQYGYAEGLRRGGYLLTVRTDATSYDRVLEILDKDGAVNMDERESQWRTEGWSSYGRSGAEGAAAGQTATGLFSSADHDGALAAGTAPTTAADRATLAADRFAGTTANTAAAGTVTSARAGAASTVPAQVLEATSEEKIPVYEEQLRVGKRDVSHGRVRLRSYVVETPVNEQVSLHNEQVSVERRPVDRPVAAGEALFQDRVIEAEERAQEAVVSKDARVKEEITLRKTAEDRTQTVNDSVRRTEVEVDDGRGVAGASRFTAETDRTRIAAHMDVIASDGTKIGVVDHLDGPDRIKLAKNASPDGQHHYVPLAWVDHVDTHVHLNRNEADAKAGW